MAAQINWAAIFIISIYCFNLNHERNLYHGFQGVNFQCIVWSLKAKSNFHHTFNCTETLLYMK